MVDRETCNRCEVRNVSSILRDQDAFSSTSRFESFEGGVTALAEGAWAAGYAAGYLDAKLGGTEREVANQTRGSASFEISRENSTPETFRVDWHLHGIETRKHP